MALIEWGFYSKIISITDDAALVSFEILTIILSVEELIAL